MMSASINHLTKVFSREETAKKMSNEAIQRDVCFLHFKNIFCLVKAVPFQSAIVVTLSCYICILLYKGMTKQ